MKRQLYFYSSDRGAVAGWLRRAADSGARRGLIIGDAEPAGLAEIARQAPLSWSVAPGDTRSHELASATDVVLIAEHEAAKVSRALHACIDCHSVVMAPITEHHSSRRTIFLLSMPKAGTHMAIRLLGLMGIERSSDRSPAPGTWSTPVGYEYHAPCRELLANDWFDPVGRQLWLRSPALFIYRDPRDIVISELDWFAKSEHAFSGYLRSCKDDNERLERLIADATVMGTIRDRVNRYVGWVHFSNVIAVSYEELVGSRGGGSDGAQCDTLWSLQLKLHIPGDPREFAAHLYDPASPTFSQGRIGRHRERFTARHYELLDALPQDFMQALGYDRDSNLSAKVAERRHGALEVKDIRPELLYLPRLVRQGVKDNNIVELAGRYFPVPQGEHLVSARDGQAFSESNPGFANLRDAIDAALYDDNRAAPIRAGSRPTELVVESYCGFNIVRHGGHWYGFDQAAGPLNLEELGDAGVERMLRSGTCLSGENLADVKAEILRRMVDKLEHVDRQQEERDRQLYGALKQDLEKLGAGLAQSEWSREGYAGLRQEVEENRAELRESQVLAAGLKLELEKLRAGLPDWLSDVGPESASQPRLLEESYRGFSLVAYDWRVWAVSQDVGPLDLGDDIRRGALVRDGKIFAAYTAREARMAVDQWCALRAHGERPQQQATELREVLTETIRSLQQASERSREELAALRREQIDSGAEVEDLRRQLGETTELLDKIASEWRQTEESRQALREGLAGLGREQADSAAELKDLRRQLGETTELLDKSAGEWRQCLEHTNNTLQNQIAELRRDYFVRLGSYLRAQKVRLMELRNKKEKG